MIQNISGPLILRKTTQRTEINSGFRVENKSDNDDAREANRRMDMPPDDRPEEVNPPSLSYVRDRIIKTANR